MRNDRSENQSLDLRSFFSSTSIHWRAVRPWFLKFFESPTFQLQVGLLDYPDRTLLAHSLWLAQTPLKVIDYGAPDQATLAAFVAHRVLRVAKNR